MAAANESQGLKIAVAAFITLTVILTVSSYFLYSNAAPRRKPAVSRPRRPPAQKGKEANLALTRSGGDANEDRRQGG